MKAVHAFGPKDVRLVDVPDPVAAEGEVLVKVLASGICGSDKWLWRVKDTVTSIAGHEVAGEVVELGRGIKRLKLGDRVAINNVVGCGVCPACRAGAYVRCPSRPGRDVNGGFGELVAAPERNCLVLEEGVSHVKGCLIFDNLGTPYSAVERAGINPGDDVLVLGCGPIGLGAVMLARLRGAFVVAADPLPYRREAALRLGAEAALEPDEKAAAALHDLTGGQGVRVVFECSAKPTAYPIGMSALRIGGIMIVLGEGGQMDLHPSDLLIRNHLSITGNWYSTMPQGRAIQDLVLQGKVDPEVLVTHRGSLVEFPQLFETVCEFGNDVLKAVVVNLK